MHNKALHDTFSAFGTVISCKVVVDRNGQSRGYSFVKLDNDESAKYAIEQLDAMLIKNKKVYVRHFIRRQKRSGNGSPKFTNVYIKTLSETYIDMELKQLYNIYSVITSVVIMKDENGNSKCFGFVNFQSPDSAVVAVERLSGTITNDG
jgi:polyadenylate-binding protein